MSASHPPSECLALYTVSCFVLVVGLRLEPAGCRCLLPTSSTLSTCLLPAGFFFRSPPSCHALPYLPIPKQSLLPYILPWLSSHACLSNEWILVGCTSPMLPCKLLECRLCGCGCRLVACSCPRYQNTPAAVGRVAANLQAANIQAAFAETQQALPGAVAGWTRRAAARALRVLGLCTI